MHRKSNLQRPTNREASRFLDRTYESCFGFDFRVDFNKVDKLMGEFFLAQNIKKIEKDLEKKSLTLNQKYGNVESLSEGNGIKIFLKRMKKWKR